MADAPQNADFQLPADFTRRIIEVDGEDGAAWLTRLPTILAECAARWGLTLERHYEPLSYNFVAPGIWADGRAIVLKAGVPGNGRLQEAEALRFFGGHGIVELLADDADLGVSLLERVQPGLPLIDLADDAEATAIAATVMRQFWHPLPADHPFTTVADWGKGFQQLREAFGGTTGPFDQQLVERAESLFADLLASSAAPVLLHGDLHHWNILSSRRDDWLAIDPKGVAGEPAYEVGALMRNPVPYIFSYEQPETLIRRRVDILEERLGFDRERMLGWSVAQAVLSAWWSYEDHGAGWEPMMAWVETLSHVR